MKIAIDVSPLRNSKLLQHRVRGTGFYLKNLQISLNKYYPENKYTYFNRGDLLGTNIDIVHYPYFEPFFLTLPLFSKNKKIVTVHDLTPLVFPEHFKIGLKGNLKWLIQKTALKNTDAIITDSESSKKDIVRYAGIRALRINVVYLAAGEEFKKYKISNIKYQILKKKYNLPDKFVLYVGDATWNKNLPKLVEAVVKIGVTMVMVGKALVDENFDKNNPWNQDLLKVQTMIKNNKNIIRLGFVPTEDLIILYNLAQVFLMPSLYEGFGLPILEAMVCGCPVVTTQRGSIPEVASDAVFYVDAEDVTSIAFGIKEVMENYSLQKKLSKKGLIQASKFSWYKTASKTVHVYEKNI